MRCSDLLLRLYDEDCRIALEGGAPMPADIRAHSATCPECTLVWEQALVDTCVIAGSLSLATPAHLQAQLLAALPASPRASHAIDLTALTWAVIGGAVGAAFVGAVLQWPIDLQLLAFAVGASLGLAFAAVSRLRLGVVELCRAGLP